MRTSLLPHRPWNDRERRLCAVQGGEGPSEQENRTEKAQEGTEGKEKEQGSAADQAERRVNGVRGDVRELNQDLTREFVRQRDRLDALIAEGVGGGQLKQMQNEMRQLLQEMAARGVRVEGDQRSGNDVEKGETWPVSEAREFLQANLLIEYMPGSMRNGNAVKNPYGSIPLARAQDGDYVDFFLGKEPKSPTVFVIQQVPQDLPPGPDGKPGAHIEDRERKCMIGFKSQAEATAAYLANYPAGWKAGPVTAVPVEQFSASLKGGSVAG